MSSRVTPRVDELTSDAEGRALRAALERNRWKMAQTADELGSSRHALRRRLKRYELE